MERGCRLCISLCGESSLYTYKHQGWIQLTILVHFVPCWCTWPNVHNIWCWNIPCPSHLKDTYYAHFQVNNYVSGCCYCKFTCFDAQNTSAFPHRRVQPFETQFVWIKMNVQTLPLAMILNEIITTMINAQNSERLPHWIHCYLPALFRSYVTQACTPQHRQTNSVTTTLAQRRCWPKTSNKPRG